MADAPLALRRTAQGQVKAARQSLAAFADMVGWPMARFQAASLWPLAKRITCIVSPRQGGKSRSLALLATFSAFRKPEQHVLIVSAGEEASRRLLAEIRRIVGASDLLRGSVVDEKAGLLTLSNGSTIRSVPASERQIRGWTVDLLLVDEAALLSDDLILGAAFPTTGARPEARIVLASSATAASGAFYEHVQRGLEGAEHISAASWALTDCEWISQATIDAARESLSPTRFACEFEGVFASGADALFPRELIERCTAPFDMPGLAGLGSDAGLGGVDWGATTDRTTIVSVSRLAEPAGTFAVTCAHAWPSGAQLDGPGGIIPEIAALPARWEQMTTELNGLGYPLSQSLARHLEGQHHAGLQLEFIHTSADSKAATYSRLRMLMEQGVLLIPEAASELRRELLMLRIQLTQGGNERIEAGVGHDDLADGLYLAAGPWKDRHGAWRTRLGAAAEQRPDQPTGKPAFGDLETVTTGSGLVIPRQPKWVRLGGERFGPPKSLPASANPWGGTKTGFNAWRAEQSALQTPMGRWFAELGTKGRPSPHPVF